MPDSEVVGMEGASRDLTGRHPTPRLPRPRAPRPAPRHGPGPGPSPGPRPGCRPPGTPPPASVPRGLGWDSAASYAPWMVLLVEGLPLLRRPAPAAPDDSASPVREGRLA